MSSELERGLSDIPRGEYFSALYHADLRQRDPHEADAMMASFVDAFPELFEGVQMIRVSADQAGVTTERQNDMMQGALMALIGLKEVIEVRKLKKMSEQ